MAERTMFKCQICQQVTPAKTKAQRLVLETRKRAYPFPPDTYTVKKKIYRTKASRGEPRPKPTGYEIVREIIACPVCAAAYNLQKDKA